MALLTFGAVVLIAIDLQPADETARPASRLLPFRVTVIVSLYLTAVVVDIDVTAGAGVAPPPPPHAAASTEAETMSRVRSEVVVFMVNFPWRWMSVVAQWLPKASGDSIDGVSDTHSRTRGGAARMHGLERYFCSPRCGAADARARPAGRIRADGGGAAGLRCQGVQAAGLVKVRQKVAEHLKI